MNFEGQRSEWRRVSKVTSARCRHSGPGSCHSTAHRGSDTSKSGAKQVKRGTHARNQQSNKCFHFVWSLPSAEATNRNANRNIALEAMSLGFPPTSARAFMRSTPCTCPLLNHRHQNRLIINTLPKFLLFVLLNVVFFFIKFLVRVVFSSFFWFGLLLFFSLYFRHAR